MSGDEGGKSHFSCATGEVAEADVPHRIGRYYVFRRLGAGGMATVFLGYDEELDRKIAIKYMHTSLSGRSEALRARTQREAQVLARLSHPNVVSVFEIGNADSDFAEQATIVHNIAILHRDHGDYDRALFELRRALRLFERAYGPEHADVASCLQSIGTVELRLGALTAAQEAIGRALALRERIHGPNHVAVAESLVDLAELHLANHEPEQALDSLTRALSIDEEALGREHPKLARPLIGLGRVALARGLPHDAIAPLERALRLLEGASAADRAEVRATLARALWAAPSDRGGDRRRADALIREAIELDPRIQESIDVWRTTHE